MDADIDLEGNGPVAGEVAISTADARELLVDDLMVVDPGHRRNFSSDHDLTIRSHNLHRNPRVPVLPKMRVKDGICDLVADLVRMPGADRFCRHEVMGLGSLHVNPFIHLFFLESLLVLLPAVGIGAMCLLVLTHDTILHLLILC